MDVRLASKKHELMSKENVVRYYFKEVSLWRGTKNWRADKPEMYNRIHKGFAVMAKVTPGLKWVYPYKYFLKFQRNKYILSLLCFLISYYFLLIICKYLISFNHNL